MLCELKIANFAIIDNVHIQFRPGLNILSGETGAGKSILLQGLGLLMGEKATGESVRTGSEQAVIEGSFDLTPRPDIRERLQSMGIDAPDGQMVVRRIVARDRSRVYINGSLSTVGILRDVVSPLVEVAGHAVPLIEMTGQHENRSLLSRSYQLDLLDQYAGVWKRRSEYSVSFRLLEALRNEIETIRHESRSRAQRLDFLIYQRDEIRALQLCPGEEETIENDTRRLKYSSRLSEFAEQTENVLYNDDDSITGRLHSLLQKASELKSMDPTLIAKLEPLVQARTLIDEVSYELRNYTKTLESDPVRLEELEDRLSKLRHLQKKYGTTASEILAALSTIEDEISLLTNSDELLAEKESQALALEGDLNKMAHDLHERRKAAALLLATGINAELKDLNMKGVIFAAKVENTGTLNVNGQTSIEFASQTSRADAPRPLARFASGGELSRILLAIKQVVGAGHFPRTYLFDEVDAGVSGPTAEKVGRKLKYMASGQQVICVTHLPQVASYGDAHFYIHKSDPTLRSNAATKTVQTTVRELSGDERVDEIARLISGEKITRTSLAHARQLLSESAAH